MHPDTEKWFADRTFQEPAWTPSCLTAAKAGRRVSVVLPAALLGAIFPFVCHLSVPPDRKAGQLVSVLYGANIAGSTAGTCRASMPASSGAPTGC